MSCAPRPIDTFRCAKSSTSNVPRLTRRERVLCTMLVASASRTKFATEISGVLSTKMQTGTYNYVPIERVSWGKPAAETVAQEAERAGANRVFCVASGTLARRTDAVKEVRASLGVRDVGLFD